MEWFVRFSVGEFIRSNPLKINSQLQECKGYLLVANVVVV